MNSVGHTYFLYYDRLSTEAIENETAHEITKQLILPPSAELKVDAVTSLEQSSPNHSTVSTSSTETLLTARDATCANTSTTSSKSVQGMDSSKSPKICESENKFESEARQNTKSETVVCKIDNTSGQYEVGVTTPSGKIKCETPVVSDTSPSQSGVCHSFGSSTPVSKNVQKLQKCDILASPCLSDIMRLDSQKNSPVVDSSAVEGGDEMEDSETDSEKSELESEKSNLNTTDDLLATAVGLGKHDSFQEGSVSSQNSDKMIEISARSDGSQSDSSTKTSKNTEVMGEVDLKYLPAEGGKCNSYTENEINTNKCAISVSESDKSSISVIEDIDESLLHRSSIHQFLNSRCNKSRTFEDSGSFLRQNNSQNVNSPCMSASGTTGVEVYYPEGIDSPCTKSSLEISNIDLSDFSNEGYSPSLKSFEKHEKGVRYVTKSRNGSRSSDYSSNGTVMFPEGSFQGQCQHRDKSLLGNDIFYVKKNVVKIAIALNHA